MRAADLAPARPRKSLAALVGVAIALSLLILYKTQVGDDATRLLEALGVDPSLALPPSVTEAGADPGVLAEGSLAPLAAAVAAGVQACTPPGTVARLRADVDVAVDGQAALGLVKLDEAATASPALLDCASRVRARTVPPLGGPAMLRLTVPAWRPAER
ncbi:MAG: hypothetical protein KC613_13915 [Myxococcales bacterium]|nr:hypothetical protein [Myxococcales bacterium]